MRIARFTATRNALALIGACLLASGACVASRPAMASGAATVAPERVTLDGILNPDSDDTLAFTPDGSTVFFDRSEGPHKTIMVSHKVNGRWSSPEVAGFSGHAFDQDPVVAPDGSYLLFDSDRPIKAGGRPLVQTYFGNHRPAPGANIWKVERKGRGWGKPVWLGPVVNDDVFVDFASIASDGTLYFIRHDQADRQTHIYRSALRNGAYLPPAKVALGDPSVSTHDPAVAPDQSFIVFDYGKVKGGLGRLCIAFREGDHWSKPVDLGDAVNHDIPWGSHIALDGRSAYFTGQTGIWRLSLASWLDAHRTSRQ